ncbi:serine/arginine repetitive matrix protein 2-like [Oncorhynchus masou masou]|uniref:serine/arginine repetitive matrix protein 2-like n=1 Tax=Oncorhynchus masou masou TaxID=90313 RepID=UPI0031835261
MALNQDEIIEGMEIKMEVEEEATKSEVQVDVAGSEESDKALSNSNLATPKRGRGRPPKNGSVSKSDTSLSNGNPSIPKRGRGRPPKNGSVSKSDKSLSNGNPSTPKRGRPKGSVFMKTKMLKVIGLAAACLPRKPVDPSPKKRGRPSKVQSTRKSLTPKGEEDRNKLESQLRRPLGRPRIYPRNDSPVTEPRGRGRPRKTEDASKSPIYGGPPRKRGRPPGAANKFKRGAEQDQDNGEPPVKSSFHAKEKSKEAGFPPVEESDQEDETGRVDQESEKWKVEYREDPKKPVTPSDPTSFLWASHKTPKRGRPKGSVSKLGASPITPKRGRPKGSVSKLGTSPITPNRGRPKGSVSKLGASPITPNRGRPKGSVSKLGASPITPNRGRPKGSVSKLLGSPITPKRGRPKGSVSKLGASPITPNRGRPKGSVSKLLGSPITPNRGRPKGSVSKLLGSTITPKRGRPKGSVFTQPKILKATGEPPRGQPRDVVDLSLDKHGRPSIAQLKRGRPKKILTPDEEEELKKLESQPRRPCGRPRIYPCDDPPVTEPRGRGRPRKTDAAATKSPIYDVPPRKRGRPPGAANKVKRGAEQNKDNGEPPVKRSFHAKEKSEEAGFPPVEESDQEDETGRVDQESEKWKVEYREDPKKPVTPSDPTSFLWASHITPKRGRPKGSISKLLGSPIPPKRGRPKGSVFTQPKILKVMKPLRGRPRKVVAPSPNKCGRPSKVESIRKSLTPKGEEDKLESQLRRPPGRPRIYPRNDSPVTEPRGRGRPRKTEDATKSLIYDGPPRKRGRPPGAANKVKRGAEQNKDNGEPPVKCNFHTKEKTEEAGFPPVEESDQEDETGRVDEENETGKNIEKSPRSQLPPVTVIALSVP